MRITRTLFLLLLLMQTGNLLSQDLSTYFLDSIQFVVNNDTLINSKKTKVYFFRNICDTEIVVFQKTPYKIVITFKFYDRGTYLVQSGWPDLYKNNKPISLAQHHFKGDTNRCDMSTGSVILRDSPYTDLLAERIFIKANFRYTYLAPKDTSNYNYPFRQGEWLGRYDMTRKALPAVIRVNYDNDLKTGPVIIQWCDLGAYTVNYDQGKKIDDGTFDLSRVKSKRYRKRLIPEILYIECNK